jgi:hypothetical protein
MKQVYNVEIEARVHGIPCLVGVVYYNKVAPCSRADNDWDYRGYTDCDYDILDRNGYKAAWLERKMTQQDKAEIEKIVDGYYEQQARYAYEL